MKPAEHSARLIDDEAPQRAPDGEVEGEQGSFYFWLGDDGVEDDPDFDSLEESETGDNDAGVAR